MGDLVRMPLSEITATLEKLNELGVPQECLQVIRQGGICARNIADLMIAATFTGHSDEQSFRENMASDHLFFSPQDWSNHFGLLPELIRGDRDIPWGQSVLDSIDPLSFRQKPECVASTHHALYIPIRCSSLFEAYEFEAPTTLFDLLMIMGEDCHQLHDVGVISPVDLTPIPGWHLVRLAPLYRTESKALNIEEAVRPGYKVADIATAYATLLMMHKLGQPSYIKERLGDTTFIAGYSSRLKPLAIVGLRRDNNFPVIREVESISGIEGGASLVTERKIWTYQSPSRLERW